MKRVTDKGFQFPSKLSELHNKNHEEEIKYLDAEKSSEKFLSSWSKIYIFTFLELEVEKVYT